MFEPLIYLGISFVFAGLIVWAIMPLVHRRVARSFDARQQASLQPDQSISDIAHSRNPDEIVGQLREKISGQTAELDNKAKTIIQLSVDRDLLKVELDALRIQHADMGHLRDVINRLETERDGLKNEVDILRAQRAEWNKSSDTIKRLEIERDNLKSQVDSLKGLVKATQKPRPRPAPPKSSAAGSGPTFLPLDPNQRAQFSTTDTDSEVSDSQRDKKDHRAAS